jgi:uncharacterized small protein (DUF1192 family)
MPLPILVLAATAQAVAEASVWIYVGCVGGGALLGAGATVGVIYALDDKKEKNDFSPPQETNAEDVKSSLVKEKAIEVKNEEILSSSRQSIFAVKENEVIAQEKLRNTSEVLETSVENMEEKSQSVEKNTDKLLDVIAHNQAYLEKHRTAKYHHPTQDLAQENIELKEKIQRLTEENQRLTAEKKQLKDGNEMKDAMLMSLSEHIKRTTASSSYQPGSR